MRIFIHLSFFLFPFFLFSQEKLKIEFIVADQQEKPIEGALVLLNSKRTFTDSKGIARFYVEKGEHIVKVKHIIYKDFLKKFSCSQDEQFVLKLFENNELLQSVVITVKEKEGITSSSVINKKAMEHLQPSSFSDLMSLLPGKSMEAPLLNRSNHLKLRETGIANEKYDISSLGVSFMIDGVPINTNSNLQETVGVEVSFTPESVTKADKKRNIIRKGVDMRTISTDEIEKVEIVRGIPSVRYGDLSSGLVKIKRVRGLTNWKGRMKSDGFSKLLYIGKGYDFQKSNLKLNVGLDYLDAKADPRNSLENYKRYTASFRTSKQFGTENPFTWDANLDYTGSIDEERIDPDENLTKDDFYKSIYKKYSFTNIFNVNFSDKIIKNINLKTNYSHSFDIIEQQKFIRSEDIAAIPINRGAGEFYGIYIEPSYLSFLEIDGKPVSFFSDLSSVFNFELLNVKNTILGGINYTYSKNKGNGQTFDPKRPPSFSGMKIRPRAFSDIPAMQNVAFYIEDNIKWDLGDTNFTFQAGVRGNSFIKMNKKYSVSNKMFFDPRFNFKVDLPKIELGSNDLEIYLTAGYGKQSKLPTMSMLYPQDIYKDYVQMNYYHDNKDYRQVHYKTVILPQVNYDILSAYNIKKELRLGLNYDYHSLYATLFKEKMTSGFREMTDYYHNSHKNYDTSKIDHDKITEAPLVDNLPFKEQAVLELSTKQSNGSAVDKTGVEFQYSGKRIESINTRLTFNGAWYQTRYYNSLPFYRASKEVVLAGKLNYNLGYYEQEESSLNEVLFTALTTDVYLPSLGLTTSLRFDMKMFTMSKDEPLNGVPTHYIDENGNKHLYTDKEKNDPALKKLIIKYSPTLFREITTPFRMRGHLKISKEFYRNFVISMYVNNLFEYSKTYYDLGKKFENKGRYEPYFGMEMNVKF